MRNLLAKTSVAQSLDGGRHRKQRFDLRSSPAPGDTDMWLICIEPEKVGHDKRTFECPRCQHLTVKVVRYREQNE